MRAKSVQIEGIMRVGEGKPQPLFLATVIKHPDDTKSVGITLSADHRHIYIHMDRESAIAMAKRILNELDAE